MTGALTLVLVRVLSVEEKSSAKGGAVVTAVELAGAVLADVEVVGAAGFAGVAAVDAA